MLNSYNIQASAAINQEVIQVMASNGDGSGASAGWESGEVTGKSWTCTADFYYQSPTAAGDVYVLPNLVGDEIDDLRVYPDGNASGKKYFTGACFVESVSVPAEVDGKVKVSATFRGKGALTQGTVA